MKERVQEGYDSAKGATSRAGEKAHGKFPRFFSHFFIRFCLRIEYKEWAGEKQQEGKERVKGTASWVGDKAHGKNLFIIPLKLMP